MTTDTLDIIDKRISETVEELKLERDRTLAHYVAICSKLAQAHAVKQLREAMGGQVVEAVSVVPIRKEIA